MSIADYSWVDKCSEYIPIRNRMAIKKNSHNSSHPFSLILSHISSTPIRNNRYIDAAKKRIETKMIGENEYFSEVKGLEGLWGYGENAEAAQRDLLSSLEEWIDLALDSKIPLPKLGSELPYYQIKAR